MQQQHTAKQQQMRDLKIDHADLTSGEAVAKCSLHLVLCMSWLYLGFYKDSYR